MRKTMATCSALAVGVFAGGLSPCQAASVTYVGPVSQNGTGFGTTHNILTVDVPNGQSSSEYGTISYNGSSDTYQGSKDTGETNHPPHSQTYSVAQLKSFGLNADNLGLVFNINEQGNNPSLTLDSDLGFRALFLNDNGTQLFHADYTGPKTTFSTGSGGQGVGRDGFLFSVNDGGQLDSFFSDNDNRLGLSVSSDFPITNAGGGPDTFSLGKVSTSTVPTPSAAWAGLSLLSVLGLRRKQRRARRGSA